MNGLIGSIALAICNPFAFVIGGILASFAYKEANKPDKAYTENCYIYSVICYCENSEKRYYVAALNEEQARKAAKYHPEVRGVKECYRLKKLKP
jgi:hypothetical protein